MPLYDLEISQEFHPEIGILIAAWADSAREWRENLEAPPQEALVWQPYPNGPSIGGLMLHMASCDRYWVEKMLFGNPVDASDPAVAYDRTMDQYIPNWPSPPNQPFDWYLNVCDKARAEVIELLKNERNPDRVIVEHKDFSFTPRWVLAHLIEHDSYHGGQAVLLHGMWTQMHI